MTFPEIPGYEVIALLGGTGREALYRARQLSLDRDVVLYLWDLSGSASNAAAEQAFAMLRRLAGLVHPHIARIHDMGRAAEGRYYYVREYIQGESLTSRLARKGALGEQEALMLAENIAHALRHAWNGAGLLPPSLHPGAVLISSEGVVKVAGWVHPDQPPPGRIGEGMQALGRLLLWMAAGKGTSPEDGGDLAHSPTTLSPEFLALVRRMRAMDEEAPYASWNELIADLERVCENPLRPASLPRGAEPPEDHGTPAKMRPESGTRATFRTPSRRVVLGAILLAALAAYGLRLGTRRSPRFLAPEDPAQAVHDPVAISARPPDPIPEPPGESPDPVAAPGFPAPDAQEALAMEAPAPDPPPEDPAHASAEPENVYTPFLVYGRLVEEIIGHTQTADTDAARASIQRVESSLPDAFREWLRADRQALEHISTLAEKVAGGARRLTGMLLRADPERPWMLAGVEAFHVLLEGQNGEIPVSRRVHVFAFEELEWTLLLQRIDPLHLPRNTALRHLARGEFRLAETALARAEALGEEVTFEREWAQRWNTARLNIEADRHLDEIIAWLDDGGSPATARRMLADGRRRFQETDIYRLSPTLLQILDAILNANRRTPSSPAE